MAANPARALLQVLDKWEVTNNARVESVRSADDLDVFRDDHLRAMRALVDLDRFIRAMEADGLDAGVYQEGLFGWIEAVVAVHTPWQSQSPSVRPAITRDSRALLQALELAIDAARDQPEPAASELERIGASLNAARELVKSSATLPDSARRYLLGLVAEGLRAIDEIEVFGTTHLRQVTFELAGALVTQAEREPEEEASKWRAAAREVAIHSLSGSLVLAAGTALRALTS